MKPKTFSTERQLKTIAPTASGQIDHRDANTPGLVLRAGTQRMTWVLAARTLHRRRDAKPGEPTAWRMTRTTLGHYPDLSLAQAREAASRMRMEIKDHGQPLRTGHVDRLVAAAQKTFAAAREKFLANAATKLRPATVRDYYLVLNRAEFSSWADRPLEGITPADVDALLETFRSAPIAGKVRRVLGSLFTFAARRLRWLTVSPIDLTENPGNYQPRERVLTEAELQKLFMSFKASPPIAFAIQFLLVTGQRSGDVRLARVQDFDRLANTWTITGSTHKSGRSHMVPLSSFAGHLLDTWFKAREKFLPPGGSELLIPSRHGKPLDVSTFAHVLHDWQKACALTDWKAARGLDDKQMQKLNVSQVLNEWQAAHGQFYRVHDLRRSAATGMQRLGIDEVIIHRVLGHTIGRLAKSYLHHTHIAERREALEAWGHYLDKLDILG